MTYACETQPRGLLAEKAAAFAALIPTLQTPRLTLRAPTVADFPLYADILCSDRGAGMGGPYARDDAWWDFVQLASGWVLHGHGGWAVMTKGETLVGFALIGFEPGDQEPELGYMLGAQFEGQGYATEAAQAVRDHAFGALQMPTLVSYVAPGNTRSARVAERLGAVHEGALTHDGDQVMVYRHTPTPKVRP